MNKRIRDLNLPARFYAHMYWHCNCCCACARGPNARWMNSFRGIRPRKSCKYIYFEHARCYNGSKPNGTKKMPRYKYYTSNGTRSWFFIFSSTEKPLKRRRKLFYDRLLRNMRHCCQKKVAASNGAQIGGWNELRNGFAYIQWWSSNAPILHSIPSKRISSHCVCVYCKRIARTTSQNGGNDLRTTCFVLRNT